MKVYVHPALALLTTLGFFALLALMIFHPIPEMSKETLGIMTGTLGTAWVNIISYYFGSSSGSATKTEIMAKGGQQP